LLLACMKVVLQMSASVSNVVMDGVEYSIIVVEGKVVGFKRYCSFNKNNGIWVELHFSQAEQVELATAELIDRLIAIALPQLVG
jgi:hypothetical protein